MRRRLEWVRQNVPSMNYSSHLALSLSEKEGKFVAQFKFTVLLKPDGPMRITSGLVEPDLYKSEKEIQDTELNKGSSPEFCELKSPEKEEKEGLQDCRECHQWRDIRRE